MTKIIRASCGARNANAVVFACDTGHLPFALFAADRITRVEPNRDFDVVIAMPDISTIPERFRRGKIRFVEIDFSALPDVPMVKAWISLATYFRWVLPSAFHSEYRTLLYLDTDTYLRRPGISDLFARVDQPISLSAVMDFQRFVPLHGKRKQKVGAKLRDLGGVNGEYYNAGVLLFQPQEFVLNDGLNRFCAAARENIKYLPIHRDQDQGAMNLAFADEIKPLNPLYNWCSRAWLNPPMVEKFDPAVLHFAGRGKPWNLQDDPFISLYSQEYRDFLDEHFPNVEPTVALDTAQWRRENPRYGVRAFDEIRVLFYRHRFRKKLLRAWYADTDWKIEKMSAAILAADVG